MLIERAKIEDARELLAYLNRVGGESDNLLFGADEFSMTVEQEERFIASSLLLVGRFEGEIVSVGSVNVAGRERIAHQGEIALSVAKKCWGRGFGKAMLSALIQLGKDQGLELLHLGVKSDNDSAIRLYEKLGFREFGRHPKFFKVRGDYFDKVLMGLELSMSKVQIHKGWSADKKFLLGDGNLLRTSDISTLERKTMEFQFLQAIEQLHLPTPKPLKLEVSSDNKEVWTTLTFLEGDDLREVLPELPLKKQYPLGVEAGGILREIHTLEAPAETPDWEEKMRWKIQRNVKSYQNCGFQMSGADVILSYLATNKHLLKHRPQVYQHGDFHAGNMVLMPTERLGVIDFNRCGFGDPWEEFSSMVFDSAVSPAFASGLVDGYFQGTVPGAFWRLVGFYTAMNMIYMIPWAIPFGEAEVVSAVERAEAFLTDYGNLTNFPPRWYRREW